MTNTIYKMVDDISCSEIMAVLRFDEIPDYGDVFDLDTFEHYNDSNCITDYDGSGDLVIDGKIARNTNVWCFNKSVLIDGTYILPYASLRELFGSRVQIAWFNK